MNEFERELHYPLGDTLPAAGSTLEIAPGVRWIRMALPFALDHINLWLLRDEMDDPDRPGAKLQGWTVVDCCVSRDESKALWEQIFADELDGLPILRVIVTHMHPDHVGLAHWLCARWSTPERPCRLWMSATDYYLARIGSAGSNGFGGEGAAVFFAAHGLRDPESMAKVRERALYYPSLVPAVPPQFVRLMDGDLVRIGAHPWRCISGHGHAPEHIALHNEALGLLIGGDMVLPRISSNISVFESEPESNPLKQFLQSIDKFQCLPTATLTLPSHGKPFTGLHKRIRQLHDHHRERLAEVMAACAERPQCAADILPVMFKRKLDLHQTTFAMGEAIAHLHALWFEGQLRRTRDADGVYRFRS